MISTARQDDISPETRLAVLRGTYSRLAAPALVRAMIDNEFVGRITLVSSFGAESAVLLHMVSAVAVDTPVIFLDTGKLFGETRRYRDRLVQQLGLTDVRAITPDGEALRAGDRNGLLWTRDTDACCDIRKVQPLSRALAGFDAWISGRKRFQSALRAALPVIEFADGRFKINPLAGWSADDLRAWMKKYDLPPHPLVADGYLSIGCMPCTRRVRAGEDPRAGRWAGRDKSECGIHVAEGI